MIADIMSPEGIAVVLVAIGVLFGMKRLPEMARSIGRAKGELQKGLREGEALIKGDSDADPPTSTPSSITEDDPPPS